VAHEMPKTPPKVISLLVLLTPRAPPRPTTGHAPRVPTTRVLLLCDFKGRETHDLLERRRPLRTKLLGPGLSFAEAGVPVQSPPGVQAPTPPPATMLRRRRRRSSSTSACFLSLFVVVILLILPAGVAATSKKQSLLNWFKRTFQGGEEDLEADKALESEAAAAVKSLTAIINGTSQPPPPGAEPPPLLLDQLRELFASLGLPPMSLAQINDLKTEDITMVRQIVQRAPHSCQRRGDGTLGLTLSCPPNTHTHRAFPQSCPAKLCDYK